MNYNFNAIKERLENELKDLNLDKKVSQNSKAVSSFVAKALIEFSRNESFGLQVMKSQRSLIECCDEIMKDIKSHISDNVLYTRAAKFYMPNSIINFIMEISTDVLNSKGINATNVDNFDVVKTKRKKIEISLDDLF